MTYNVFSGTLNRAQSVYVGSIAMRPIIICFRIFLKRSQRTTLTSIISESMRDTIASADSPPLQEMAWK